MRKIFSDFEILVLEKDPSAPGVFLKAKKPTDYIPNNLQDVALYSIILGKRTIRIPDIFRPSYKEKIAIYILKSKIKELLPSSLLSLLRKQLQ